MFDSLIFPTLKNTLESILYLKIELVKSNPLRAGCHILLPAQIANKHACMNPKNKDNDHCMLFAILAALHPQDKNAWRPQHYLQCMPDINVKGINLPMKVMDVPKLEHQNGFSINVYMLHFKKGKHIVSPVHCWQDRENKEHHVNLLHFQDY